MLSANVIQTGPESGFYVAGGTLRHDAPSYVERRADKDLHDNLTRGQFCYVLTARQMGKSSLMARTASKLRQAGVVVVTITLTEIGQNVSVEQWYSSLMILTGRQIGLEGEMIELWREHLLLSPMQRWLSALRRVALARGSERLVIFLDEVDVTRSLPFSTDEFFAGIRECYNRRAFDDEMGRLAFCLMGVASPTDLIRDARLTPFNIGHRIELHDFTAAETAPLARGLGREAKVGDALLERVFYWTEGHPYLTQRLCQAVAENENVNNDRDVDRLCGELFFSSGARETDTNLSFVRKWMLRDENDTAGLLDLYSKIKGRKHVPDDSTNALIGALHLSGIIRTQDGLLKVRNRIYERSFNKKWILANMPDAEARRRREAYRRGVLRTSLVAGLMVMIVSVLAIFALNQREQSQRLLNYVQSKLAPQETEGATTERKETLLKSAIYHARIRLAQRAWENANVLRVEELLDEMKPQGGEKDLRAFEWYQLWRLTHREKLRLNRENQIVTLAFSQNEKQIAISEAVTSTGNQERYRISLRDIGEGTETKLVETTIGGIFWLTAFTPDLRYVIVNGREKSAELFDLRSGNLIPPLFDHRDELSAIAISPDARRLVTADRSKTLKFWDVTTRRSLTRENQARFVIWASFSPDGRRVVTADGSRQVRVWNAFAGREMITFKINEGAISAAAFFADGERLLIATKNGLLQVRDLKTGKITVSRETHSGLIEAIAFSPDKTMVATGGNDRVVKIWDANILKELVAIKGHGSSVSALAWSADSKKLVTGSADRSVKVWDIEAILEEDLIKPEEFVDSYLDTCFTSDNKLLAAGITEKGEIKVWNLTERKELCRLRSVTGERQFAVFSPKGERLATGNPTSNNIEIWNVITGQQVGSFESKINGVFGADFSPDGKKLVFLADRHEQQVWSVKEGRKIDSFACGNGNSFRAAFSRGGRFLASACQDKSVKVWDISTQRLIATLSGHEEKVRAIAFSPDERIVATGGQGLTVRLWDVKTGRELKKLGQADYVQRISFSPDGKRLVTGDRSGTVKMWDVLIGQEIMTLAGHTGEITSITFSDDGTKLVISDSDGVVKVWRAAKKDDVG